MNLLPSTPDTQGIVNSKLMANLPTDSQIINFGRGDAVVESDLLRWLDENTEASALLDVFDIEPLPDSHVYWGHPQVEIWPTRVGADQCSQCGPGHSRGDSTLATDGADTRADNRERGY